MTAAKCAYCGRPVEIKRDDRDRKIISCPKKDGGCGAWSRLDPSHPYPAPWPAAPAPKNDPAPTDPAPTEPANPKQPEPDHDEDRNPFAIW